MSSKDSSSRQSAKHKKFFTLIKYQLSPEKTHRFLEWLFSRVGFRIAGNPWKTIVVCLLLSVLFGIGNLRMQVENRIVKNWASQSSDVVKYSKWLEDVFPEPARKLHLMLELENFGDLLNRRGLIMLYRLDILAQLIHHGEVGRQWTDICYSPSRNVSRCNPTSILELWRYDYGIISTLTENDIKATLENPGLINPVTGMRIHLDAIIGGIKRGPDGKILSASVLKLEYKIKNQAVYDKKAGKEIDKEADEWEKEFENVFKKKFSGYNIYTLSTWSLMNTLMTASTADVYLMFIGYSLMIIYMAVMLGSYSRIKHKSLIAIGGVLIVCLSILISFGLASLVGLNYTLLNNALPLLLLGIGVDDIFVICKSWDNNDKLESGDLSIPDRMSSTLKHASVSILVTSVTDILAFAVGSISVLPALRSFSIFCSFGILAVFLLTNTLFVALLALDAKRQLDNRDACLICIKLPDDYKPTKFADKKILQTFMKDIYAPALLSKPGKVIVLCIVVALFASGCYGVTKMEQDFDEILFMLKDARPRIYIEKERQVFHENGATGSVFIGKIDYYNSYVQMNTIRKALQNDHYIAKKSVNSWYHHFHQWLFVNHRERLTPQSCTIELCRLSSGEEFNTLLQKFLGTQDGRNYMRFIAFENGHIKASHIAYQHVKIYGAEEQRKALDSIRRVIKPGLFKDEKNKLLPFSFAFEYFTWETNQIIGTELVRNLSLAGICIFVVTLLLLANFITSIIVFGCVFISVLEVGAFISFWGLKLDTVTSVFLVVMVGLTVDYSVHIAHAFVASKEKDRNARITAVLSDIGPAVLHGGASTFVATILMAVSKLYVIFSFFRIIFLVVLLGVFHGVVFLPVVLSVIGPISSSHTKTKRTDNNNGTDKKVVQDAPVNNVEENKQPNMQGRIKRKEKEKIFVVDVCQSSSNIAYETDTT